MNSVLKSFLLNNLEYYENGKLLNENLYTKN